MVKTTAVNYATTARMVLKNSAVILVSPDKDFSNGSQRLNQQSSVGFINHLILCENIMEIPKTTSIFKHFSTNIISVLTISRGF